jgi:hypothetical protein
MAALAALKAELILEGWGSHSIRGRFSLTSKGVNRARLTKTKTWKRNNEDCVICMALSQRQCVSGKATSH